MDATAFDLAYQDLLAAAGSIGESTSLSPDQQDAIDWTLSHIALSDRTLAATARDVLTGRSPVVDNRDAMDDATISALITATNHLQRVDLVRRNAADLSGVITSMPEHVATTLVELRLVSRDGRSLPPQQLPWADLIRLRATDHIPGHAARITALAVTGRSS